MLKLEQTDDYGIDVPLERSVAGSTGQSDQDARTDQANERTDPACHRDYQMRPLDSGVTGVSNQRGRRLHYQLHTAQVPRFSGVIVASERERRGVHKTPPEPPYR